MTRPLRLAFPGALLHITSRGNEKRPTFLDDRDRRKFLDLLGETVRTFDWILIAYVLMSNHYHLLVELCGDTLSDGVKWLNGEYAKWFNRVHDRVGHLFQGRFRSPLIDHQTYFETVLRYVVLNPVRANVVKHPAVYEWSSYRATAGLCDAPSWLAVDNALASFGDDREVACARYTQFVEAGIGGVERPWKHLVGQMYLGSEEFVEQMRERVEMEPRASEHIHAQRFLARPDMRAIVTSVANTLGISENEIRHGRGGTARRVVAWIASYEGLLKNSEIAPVLRLRSETQVTNLVQQCDAELDESEPLRQSIDRCLATLGRQTGNYRPDPQPPQHPDLAEGL